jgi:DNA-binding NtrC family response regulator
MERHSILLVEDNESFAGFLKSKLEHAGHEVESVKNADQGVIRATERKFDAVVTDLQLPGRVGLELMGGLRLVTDLRRLVPNLPIIVMTAFHSTDAAIEATKLGAFDYLIKPTPVESELLRFVSELLSLIEKAVLGSRPEPGSESPDEAVEEGGGLIGRSRPMQHLYKEIGRLAGTHLPILIMGEAGTGKELVARTIQQHSAYADGQFIVINCLGVSERSLLSKLAMVEKDTLEAPKTAGRGVVSQARIGTVYLDEVSELAPAVLHVLARLARHSSVHYRGAAKAKPALRLLTATHSAPKTLSHKWPRNSALQGLLNALTRATIHVPPLRERLDDVPALVRYFIRRFGTELGVRHPSISAEAVECLQHYDWPGNVTELEHVVSLLLVNSPRATISAETVAAVLAESTRPSPLTAPVVSDRTQPTETRSPHLRDYELVRQIGRGAYGEVWLARTVTGGYRAAKVISRSRLPDTWPFEQEFSALKRIESISQKLDGLVRILHIGRNDRSGYYYYVMELADDQTSRPIVDPQTYVPRTLAGEIRQRVMLPLDECLQIGISLAITLDNLHAQRLVHRDIKPSNVIFVDGAPKLGDIGLVTDVGGETYCGTQGYIAPERPGRPPADVYSLGKVIYEMITGMDRLKFPEQPSGSPPLVLRLFPILLRACDGDPRTRFQSARELRDALATFQAEHPP